MTDTACPPMILSNGASRLELSIVRYQYPAITVGDDANWLMIAGDVHLASNEWSFRDPSLTTLEVAGLADWLEALAKGAPTADWADIVEINIAFERASPTTIRVSFWAESAPDWAKKDGARPGFTIPIDNRLLTAAAQLRAQLLYFPHRGADD